MLRRLHTRIIGMGSICGLAPSPPAEVLLKTLPLPSEVDPVKFQRFRREEEEKERNAKIGPASAAIARYAVAGDVGSMPLRPEHAPEPFFDIVGGAAGHKHVVFVTREGHLITFGENHYGQTAAQRVVSDAGSNHSARAVEHTKPQASTSDWDPLFIHMGNTLCLGGDHDTGRQHTHHVACGSNFTIVYRRGSRHAIAFGNNHVGQLGVGHKEAVDKESVFQLWDPAAPWWPLDSCIHRITSGYNHTIVELYCGSLFAFGSNTWGELSIGTTTSPMWPVKIDFFEKKSMAVKKVCCANSMTVFLTEEGRVYGCGATNQGQLPANAFEPVPIPLIRTFIEPGVGNGAPRATGKGPDGQKLIRIRDIACAGSLVVFLSSKNEILIQGSLTEFGVLVPSPRLATVDQSAAVSSFKEVLEGRSSTNVDVDGFIVEQLVSGPSTVLVRYRNGCIGALGSNSEGQLQHDGKEINGRVVNLAPSFAAMSLFPMYVPASVVPRTVWERSWLTCGNGFSLLIDNDEVYPVCEQAGPIELPPGRKKRMSGAGRQRTPHAFRKLRENVKA